MHRQAFFMHSFEMKSGSDSTKVVDTHGVNYHVKSVVGLMITERFHIYSTTAVLLVLVVAWVKAQAGPKLCSS